MAIIGIDLGGTKLASAIFNKEGKILEKDNIHLKSRKGREVGTLITEQIQHFLKEAEERDIQIEAIGISVPGIYYSTSGRIWAPNIPGWDNYPLLKEIQSILNNINIKVKIDSDRACYILGETWQGAARGCTNAIFVAVGTGIGAGIMVDGKILRGHEDIAGATGWMALDRPFKREYKECGCFEYHASGEGIAKVVRKMLKEDTIYSGVLRSNNIEKITSHDIFEAYKIKDPIAVHILDESIEFWGMAVANYVSLFNPEKIIFGGGVFGPAAQFIDRIKEEARKWAQPISIKQVSIVVSELGKDAGLIGAGYLAMLSDLG